MRNPLLYSEPSEIQQFPPPAPPLLSKETSDKSSFLFYIIILANSLLVLFVLGFIWLLFLKSPDIQIKEISNRLFGTGTEQAQQTVIAPKVETEIVISSTQQEKDEIQQAKLKQMREREELAVERARLETIKAEIEQEKIQAKKAQLAVDTLKVQDQRTSMAESAPKYNEPGAAVADDTNEEPVEIEQTRVEELPKKILRTPLITQGNTKMPVANTTSSQVDLIVEALKQQQQNKINGN